MRRAFSVCTWINGHPAGLERECFAAEGQARFETEFVKHHQKVHEEVLHALSHYLSGPCEHPEAYATLRSHFRGAACSCSRWDVGCATHTRGAGVHPAVVQGAVDILERTFPNRR